MGKEEFSILVKAMKAVYADVKFIADSDAFNVWYELLKDIPYELCQAAVHKYMSTNTFPPTIADIRKIAFEVSRPEMMNEAEAWGLVIKAIGNSQYNSMAEFEKLPAACQRAVGRPDSLKEWANMDIDTVNSVIQSNFMRVYRAQCQKEQEYGQLPASTKAMIDKITEHTSMKFLEGEAI